MPDLKYLSSVSGPGSYESENVDVNVSLLSGKEKKNMQGVKDVECGLLLLLGECSSSHLCTQLLCKNQASPYQVLTSLRTSLTVLDAVLLIGVILEGSVLFWELFCCLIGIKTANFWTTIMED